jgi:hypothetical protein
MENRSNTEKKREMSKGSSSPTMIPRSKGNPQVHTHIEAIQIRHVGCTVVSLPGGPNLGKLKCCFLSNL